MVASLSTCFGALKECFDLHVGPMPNFMLEDKSAQSSSLKPRLSLINVDHKLIIKSVANKRIKSILPDVISGNQFAFDSNRNIDEPLRFISDLLECIALIYIYIYVYIYI